jgi:hypothetical protein
VIQGKCYASKHFPTFPQIPPMLDRIGNIPQKPSINIAQNVSLRFPTLPLNCVRLCISCRVCSGAVERMSTAKEGVWGMSELSVCVRGTMVSAAERNRRLAKVYKLLIDLARKKRAASRDGIGDSASEKDGVEPVIG